MSTSKTYLIVIGLIVLFCATLKAITRTITPSKRVAVLLVVENDDTETINTIYTSLMTAEKVARVLDIEMIAQDEVNDDVFVFALNSKEQKNLTLQMFDEEGYDITAHREFGVERGENYNALNVNSMQDGTYIFKITDEIGAEKSMKVTIKRD